MRKGFKHEVESVPVWGKLKTDPSFVRSPGPFSVNTIEHLQETVEVGIAVKQFPNNCHVDYNTSSN